MSIRFSAEDLRKEFQKIGFLPLNSIVYSEQENSIYCSGYKGSKALIVVARIGEYSIKIYLFGQVSGNADPHEVIKFSGEPKGAAHFCGLFYTHKEINGDDSLRECVLFAKKFVSLYGRNLLTRFKDDVSWWIDSQYPKEKGMIKSFYALPSWYLSGNLPLVFYDNTIPA